MEGIRFTATSVSDRLPAGRSLFTSTGDGRHFCWWEWEEEPEVRGRFAWDGLPGRRFDGLQRQHSGELVVWSPRSHVGFYGMRGNRGFVAVDDTESEPFEVLTRSVPLTFSPDDRHFAYGRYVGDAPRLFVDHRLTGDYGLAPCAPLFSPDGRRLAVVATDHQPVKGHDAGDARQWVVLDGEPLPAHSAIGVVSPKPPRDIVPDMDFSPDSRRFAYVGVEAQADGRRLCRLWADGVLGDPLAWVELGRFSLDSRRLCWVEAVDGRHRRLVVDGTPGRDYGALPTETVQFSPDGRHLACAAQLESGSWIAVLDGEEGPPFSGLTAGVFSPDSRHLAYVGRRPRPGLLGRLHPEELLVVDGEIVAAVDEASAPPAFSPDGRHVAVAGRLGKTWHLFVDGQAGPGLAGLDTPVYSAAGRLAALQAAGPEGGFRLWVDGAQGPTVEETSALVVDGVPRPFAFTPDGQHTVMVGRLGDRWHPIVDDQVGPGFEWLGAPVMRPGGEIVFWAYSGPGVTRIEALLPTAAPGAARIAAPAAEEPQPVLVDLPR